jgi:hypothetical protein
VDGCEGVTSRSGRFVPREDLQVPSQWETCGALIKRAAVEDEYERPPLLTNRISTLHPVATNKVSYTTFVYKVPRLI